MKLKIFTRDNCVYCDRAKTLFKEKNLEYFEIKVTDDNRQHLLDILPASAKRTLPQIFIIDTNEYIGGYDDFVLYLKKQGKT